MNLRLILPAPARPFADVDAEQIARYMLAAFLVVLMAIQLEWVWWLRVIAFVVIGFGMADYAPKSKNRRASRIGLGLFALFAVFLSASTYYAYVMKERSAKIMQAAGPMPPLLAQEEKEIKCGDDWPVCSSRDYSAALEHYTTWLVSNGITLGVAGMPNDITTPWLTKELGPEKARAAIARGRAAAGARPY